MSKQKADKAVTEPTTESAPAKAKKVAAVPFKKGAKIQWNTGSRAGIRAYTGVVLAFVPKGTSAQGLSKQAVAGLTAAGIDPNYTSNRDRYVVKVGTVEGRAPEADTYGFCNAKGAAKAE